MWLPHSIYVMLWKGHIIGFQAMERELADLKGLFTGKRRRELETMIAEIERELNALR